MALTTLPGLALVLHGTYLGTQIVPSWSLASPSFWLRGLLDARAYPSERASRNPFGSLGVGTSWPRLCNMVKADGI